MPTDDERYYSNPRLEMAPEDYAPMRHWTDDADYDYNPPEPDDDEEGDDE